MSHQLPLRLLPETLACARLDAASPAPPWAFAGDGLASITRRGRELSILCADEAMPADLDAWRGLRAFEVEGPLGYELVGVMSALAGPLADAGVWILALATYETDVLVVKGEQLEDAIVALEQAGHRVSRRT